MLADARQLRVRADRRPRACARDAGSCSGCGRCRRSRRPRQQLGEPARLRAQARAVGVDVLAEQRDLADAVGGERLDLGDELLERARRPRARASTARCSTSTSCCSRREICTQPWNVARALGRQVPGEALELEEALRGERVAGQELGELVDLAGPERDVDERELRGTPASLTDCAQQPPTPMTRSGSSRLSSLRLAQVGDEAVVGLLADRAGVEEDQVGVARARAPRCSRATRACPSCAPSRARSSGTRRW